MIVVRKLTLRQWKRIKRHHNEGRTYAAYRLALNCRPEGEPFAIAFINTDYEDYTIKSKRHTFKGETR